jgi:hypothetical protein
MLGESDFNSVNARFMVVLGRMRTSPISHSI